MAVDSGRIFQAVDECARTVNIDSSFVWINEPAKLGAIRDIFGHLVLDLPEPITRRHNFGYEVRT